MLNHFSSYLRKNDYLRFTLFLKMAKLAGVTKKLVKDKNKDPKKRGFFSRDFIGAALLSFFFFSLFFLCLEPLPDFYSSSRIVGFSLAPLFIVSIYILLTDPINS